MGRQARRRRGSGLMGFFLLMTVGGGLGLLLLVGTATFGAARNNTAVIGRRSPDLNPLQAWALSTYLSLQLEALQTPASSDPTPVAFVVLSGETADDVATRLAELDLVSNAQLLRLYMRYNGLDKQIEAGNFQLAATMTIPEVAQSLITALPTEVSLRIWEGWRGEQVAEALDSRGDLEVDGQELLSMVRRESPLPGNYTFLDSLPAGAALEGFLFPDTYRFLPETTTAEVLDRVLATFDERVTPELRTAATARGLSLFEVVTLASIVEREAVLDEERPIIASVFFNRLALDMRLAADPTTQYALAGPGDWWPELNIDPRLVDHPYNTYVHTGLPPGPIANPGLASIRAVAYPAETDYLYFRATCERDGRHNFSYTYEEHLGYACP